MRGLCVERKKENVLLKVMWSIWIWVQRNDVENLWDLVKTRYWLWLSSKAKNCNFTFYDWNFEPLICLRNSGP